MNEDGTATTTFDNGEKREAKLTSFVKVKEEADKAQNSAEAAYTSMVAAQGSERKASVSEVNAKSSEQASKLSETNARKSEESAASSAATATGQASSARTSASNASVSEANAKASEKAASVSASNAKASADTASDQAYASASSATSAKNSATSASQSASSASSSASSASNSASSAASSAASASDSKDKASEYKTSASGSATAAASSASSASTSATNAKAAMNTANTAASSASTSATSASTSASNASKSEVAAKTAQAEAEKARDDANSVLAKLTGVMKYAGQVDNYSDLANIAKSKGDVWNIVNADATNGIKAGDNVAWNGADWDNLSGIVDLSAYAEKADYQKAITSATANGATITFNHKDGTTSTATVNNVASATAATNDAKGQKIDATYEKISDASNIHASLQNSINTKLDKTGNAVSATKLQTARTLSLTGKATGSTTFDGSANASINVTFVNADTASRAINDGVGNNIADTYVRHYQNIANKDLNDLKLGGLYANPLNANATAERHYPEVNHAGSIFVINNGANGDDGCTQVYTTYDSHNSYKREYDVSLKTWSAWRRYAFEDSTVANAQKLSTARKINITGNATGSAAFDGSADISISTTVNESKHAAAATALQVFTYRPSDANIQSGGDGLVRYFLATGEMKSNKPIRDAAILHFAGDNNSGWDTQLAITNVDANIQTRAQSGGTWGDWKTFLDEKNYTNYAPTKTGGGASGTWGINITGTATKANQDTSGNVIADTYAKKAYVDERIAALEDAINALKKGTT